jgi:hypothetical protein
MSLIGDNLHPSRFVIKVAGTYVFCQFRYNKKRVIFCHFTHSTSVSPDFDDQVLLFGRNRNSPDG